MPDFPLSSRSIAVLAEAIVDSNSAATMGTLFLNAGVDRWEPNESRNKLDRATKLLKGLRSADSAEANTGALELARLVLKRGKGEPSAWSPAQPARWWPDLEATIAADGWDFDTEADRLIPTVPGATVNDHVSWIDKELRRKGWNTAAGHYSQAVDAFASGNWASANSQLRAFFEDVVRRAGRLPDRTGSGQVQDAFDALDDAGVLVPGEKEFGKYLWRLLHANGPHPGLGDQHESRFRLLTLTGYVRYLLERL